MEPGIAHSQAAKCFPAARGFAYVPRAPEQQVAHIDRIGALLRDTLHRITTQCTEEGANAELKYVPSEAAFAGNALLTVNGSSPYNAVFGRAPPMLPDVVGPIDDAEAGPLKHVARLRELSIQQMVERAAKARLQRAWKTRTAPAGQSHEYKHRRTGGLPPGHGFQRRKRLGRTSPAH